jgi:dTDP-4-amino-4,6-dideoxygalactose transaminase
MKIKFLDLVRSYNQIKDEVNENIQNVLTNANYIHGKEVKEFEENFAKYIGTDYCIGVGNGTDALEIGIQSLELEEGAEIIVQGNTYIATCLGVLYNKHKLVICDCDPETYMIDIDDLERKITDKTKAIVIVHLYGFMPDMDRILELCEKHKLELIEDCAQAHGAKWKGRNAGTFGRVSCFSFYPGKNLGAYGDGGAICVHEKILEQKIRKLSNLGCIEKYKHECIGRNSRLDTIQAVVLDTKLKYLDENNSKRRSVAARYSQELAKYVKVPTIHFNCDPVYHLYSIQVELDQRDKLKEYLLENGIECGIHYPISITETEALKERTEKAKTCIELSKKILSLPIFPEMKEEEVEYVIEKVKEYYETKLQLTKHEIEDKPGILHSLDGIHFDTKRMFYIDSFKKTDIPAKRGFHANINFNELLLVQKGKIQIELTDRNRNIYSYTIGKDQICYIPKNYWIEYTIEDEETILMVLADKILSESKSIRTREEFVKG